MFSRLCYQNYEETEMDQKLIREQFAVMNNAYRRYSFSYFLDSMERLGLYQIDLWGGSPHFYARVFDTLLNR